MAAELPSVQEAILVTFWKYTFFIAISQSYRLPWMPVMALPPEMFLKIQLSR